MALFNCLHPRLIRDGHGNFRRVPCGHCEACQNNKSLRYSQDCKIESSCHKYCMFVTLSYSQKHLPLVRPLRSNGDMTFVCTTPRLFKHWMNHKSSPFFSYCPESWFKDPTLSIFHDKFNLPSSMRGRIPVLDRYDLQDFLKRLRFNLNKYTDEKIRYFAIGEYGPVHFRPHYHLLVWFDTLQTYAYFRDALYKSWPFGRVDSSLSKGKCANYVSAYANSSTSLSRLHQLRSFRPFVLHSSRLARGFYQGEVPQIYEYEYSQLAEKVFTDGDRVKSVAPSLSFETEFYPKCVNYDAQCSGDRLVCYTVLQRAYKEYGEKPITQLATDIFNDPDGLTYTTMQRLTYLGDCSESCIRSMLYTSLKFLRLCGDYNIGPSYLLSKIEQYHSDKDYRRLVSQLSSQQEYSSTCSEDNRCFLLFWYDNFYLDHQRFDEPRTYNGTYHRGMPCWCPSYSKPIRDYCESLGLEPNFISDAFFSLHNFDAWNEFFTMHHKIASDRIKHKKLNDLNKIFNY